MERIDILRNTNVIQEDTYTFVNEVILLMKKMCDAEEEAMEVMITHLAMATERIKQGNMMEEMVESTYLEIREQSSFEKAQEALELIVACSNVTFPKSERQYMMLHLCTTLKGGNNDA